MSVDAGKARTTDKPKLLVYGSYGYSGDLIVQECLKRDISVVLGGRDGGKLSEQAARYKLPVRRFALDSKETVTGQLTDIDAVLHCAGPYIHTSEVMTEACIASGTHYLDITGEFEVFESIAGKGLRASDKNIVLLPGVGFDVVASDCLARHAWEQLQSAIKLRIYIYMKGGVSYGSASTVIEHSCNGGAVRRKGVICRVGPGSKKARRIFNGVKKTTILIPWGDLSTAYHSTGISEIEVYMAVPRGTSVLMKIARLLRPLFRTGFMKSMLRKRAGKRGSGPTAEQRQNGSSHIIVEVMDLAAKRTFRYSGPDGYTLTARTAAESAKRVLAGEVSPGFNTPSVAFGSSYILEFEGTEMQESS